MRRLLPMTTGQQQCNDYPKDYSWFHNAKVQTNNVKAKENTFSVAFLSLIS